MKSKHTLGIRRIAKIVSLVGLVSAGAFISAATASTYDITADAQAQALKSWHETMKNMAPPTAGCFHASYPSVVWEKASCGTTSYRSNPHVNNTTAETVGNGNDYAAGTANVTRSATGS